MTMATRRSTTALWSSAWFWKLWVWSWMILMMVARPDSVQAKRVSGDVKLSGEKSEKLLASFAVVPTGGWIQVNFTTGRTLYEDEYALGIHLFRDLEWPKFNNALTCSDKIRFKRQAHRVQFELVNGAWVSKPIRIELANARGDDEGEAKGVVYRPHYWYVVLNDCSLETGYQRDQRVPMMHYDLVALNRIVTPGLPIQETHLSADELSLMTLHLLTLVVSSLVVVYLMAHVSRHLLLSSGPRGQAHSVHAAVLWVMLAAALDAGSSLMEIWHLSIYDINGVGLYSADAASAHLEALCDTALVLLLLAVSAGWTLPSDVIRVNLQESLVQRIVTDLAKPLSTHFSGSTVVALITLGFHVVLAQWGRTYNEDFESYHDLEHLPGRLLMGFRILCGLLLVICTVQTRNKCSLRHLQSFYAKVAVLGLVWLLSLPALSYACSLFVPYYLRHPAVFLGAAVSQSSSLFLFAWLVTSHSTAYHQFSHMAASSGTAKNHEGASLTEALYSNIHLSSSPPSKGTSQPTGGLLADDTEPRTWKLGKAKVRLD